MNFIEAVKKALFEESRKYSKAQERNLNNLLSKIINDKKKVDSQSNGKEHQDFVEKNTKQLDKFIL